VHGPPKNRDNKAPTISDPIHWVSAEQFKAFAKNYGDAEKIISDNVDINYVHQALSQPNDIPADILISYSDLKAKEDQVKKESTSDDKESSSITTVKESATSRASTRSKTKALLTLTSQSNITNTMSLEDLNAQLLSSRLSEAVKAQSVLKTYTQALSLRLHEAIQGKLRTKMQETPEYRKAFESNDLLNMWRILKQTCFAGFTDEAIQRFQAQFLKLKQQPYESFHTYYLNFQSQLAFLGQLLPDDYPCEANKLTALFIEGLDDTTYKRTRDQLYLTRESNLDSRWSFPQDWEQAATYFRDMPADPLATPPPTPGTPTETPTEGTTNVATTSMANASIKTPNQDGRSKTPRRKTPLNAETSDNDYNFSYTGNDGRQHIMPNFILPTIQTMDVVYLKLSASNLPMTISPNAVRQLYKALIKCNFVSLVLTNYVDIKINNSNHRCNVITKVATNAALTVDLDVDSDNPTDRYEYFDIDSVDLTDPRGRNTNLNTSSFYLHAFLNTNLSSTIIFDPGATHSLVNDLSLLSNIKNIPAISINGVGGSVDITRQGTFSIFGPAYYLSRGQLNIATSVNQNGL
jgi:hypothetical protein